MHVSQRSTLLYSSMSSWYFHRALRLPLLIVHNIINVFNRLWSFDVICFYQLRWLTVVSHGIVRSYQNFLFIHIFIFWECDNIFTISLPVFVLMHRNIFSFFSPFFFRNSQFTASLRFKRIHCSESQPQRLSVTLCGGNQSWKDQHPSPSETGISYASFFM